MRYVAMDIGSIECGEESHLLGVFDDMDDALDAISLCAGMEETGTHVFEAFPVERDNEFLRPGWMQE